MGVFYLGFFSVCYFYLLKEECLDDIDYYGGFWLSYLFLVSFCGFFYSLNNGILNL